MRIRKKLHLSILASMILACAILAMVIKNISDLGRDLRRSNLYYELVNKTFELNVLADSYLLHPHERTTRQWNAVSNSLGNLLQKIKVEEPEQRELVEDSITNFQDLEQIFSQLVSNLNPAQSPSVAALRRQRLAMQLSIKLRFLATQAHKLFDYNHLRLLTAQKRSSLITIGLILFLVSVTAAISLFTGRSIVNSLLKLQEGTKAIIEGNWDYRIQVGKADEIDDLAQSFNKMSDHLKISYAALEREILERRNAEQTVRKSEKQLRLLSSKLLSAQEEERKRIARELHDSIGSSLSAIKYTLENTIKGIEHQESAAAEALEKLVSVTQHAIEESRRIMTDLRPSMLDDLGIVITCGWLCREFEKIYSHIHIQKRITVEESEIPDQLKIVIFRIVQEGLNNIAKYSNAKHVSLALVNDKGMLQLTIEDDGKGFNPSEISRSDQTGGLGLGSMKERAELTGGTFLIESAIGKGTKIQSTWPITIEA